MTNDHRSKATQPTQVVAGWAVLLLLSIAVGALTPSTVHAQTSDEEFVPGLNYRSAGFLFGLTYHRLDGSGRLERYLPETDSYEFAGSSGRALYGMSFGGHIWSQRTSLQVEFAMSTGEYLEEGGLRETTDGRTVDTYVDYGYAMVGVRLRQALITRRINASIGYGIIEEGRSRKARAARVKNNSFPPNDFPYLSWGVDLRLNPAMLIGVTRTETYEHDKYEDLRPIEGWTATSIHLTLIF